MYFFKMIRICVSCKHECGNVLHFQLTTCIFFYVLSKKKGCFFDKLSDFKDYIWYRRRFMTSYIFFIVWFFCYLFQGIFSQPKIIFYVGIIIKVGALNLNKFIFYHIFGFNQEMMKVSTDSTRRWWNYMIHITDRKETP